ncbi:tetratricopeptide repeat protein [Duganella sp. Root1480D1]|uniref:tetratricopeptide repeat protein n=1 Tax=Duganella sp. Root1480D1 TaxID=1736471 RepID=UPI0009E99A78|nr:tetratricopeptide repeat protein [Duganella sp. Root1480D1]
MKTKAILFALALLAGCATTSNESEYDQGVKSFRAKDYSEARAHWGVAAKKNVRAAYNNLGYLLYFGLGGASEPERAVSLWVIAAKNGDREAQWHLASAYEEGKGVTRDLVSAYAWYRCAEANYSAAPLIDQADLEAANDTTNGIARVIALLSGDQVQESEALARQYINAFPYSSRWLIPDAQTVSGFGNSNL